MYLHLLKTLYKSMINILFLFSSSNSRVVVTSSSPVMVLQFVKSQDGRDNPEEADPAMFVVPAENNFVSTGTFITPVYSGGNTPGSDYLNYLTLVIVNGQQGKLYFCHYHKCFDLCLMVHRTE